MRKLLSSVLFCFSIFPLTSIASPQDSQADSGGVRIGLVLGGGGARGLAHIGVLKKLEELRIPISCIAGTSMGGLVAGAYSSGLKANELERVILNTDWRDLFNDAGDFENFTPRHKQTSQAFIPGVEAGIRNNKLMFPSAVLSGQKIKFYINRMVGADASPQLIENQTIPLALVTTDITTGQKVVYKQGDLATVMRATMSVPGLMAPVKYDKHTLVDGGLVDNVPVTEVQKLCQPEVIIAINVGSPLLTADEIESSPLSVAVQMVALLTEQNVDGSLAKLRPQQDIYLKPDLEGISAAAFEDGTKIIAKGYQAAHEAEQILKKLSTSQTQYAVWQGATKRQNLDALAINAINVANTAPLAAKRLKNEIDQPLGMPLDTKNLEKNLLDVYADGRYYQLDYNLTRNQTQKLGGAILNITPTEKPWGPNYVRTGLNLAWDSSDNPNYNVRLAYHVTEINPYGGELIIGGQLGQRDRLGLNWYQPLLTHSKLFSEVDLSFSRQRLSPYQNTQRLADYLSRSYTFDTAIGYQLSRYGTVKGGVRIQRQKFDIDTGIALVLPNSGRTTDKSWYILGEFDRMNRAYFPTRGWRARIEYENLSQFSKLTFNASAAQSLGNHVLLLRGSHTYSPKGTLDLANAAFVGGPLNVAGLAQGQISGDEATTLGLQFERIIGKMPLGIRGDLRLGLQLDAARVKNRFTETQQSGVVNSTGLYLGGETPLGAVYIGVAKATDNKPRLYLFLGTP